MRTNSGGTISDADFLQTEINEGVGFDSPAYIALMQGVYNLLKKSINPESSFEIGAGTGVLLSIMAREIPAVGIDPMQIHVDYCTGHAPHTVNCYHRMKIQDYRFTQKFDVAISIEVFEHIPGDEVPVLLWYVAEHCRYFLFSSTPNHIPEKDDEWGHINIHSVDEWKAIFSANGWDFVTMTHNPLPWSMLFMSRLYDNTPMP